MSTMKAYDPNRLCPKCGFEEAGSRYNCTRAYPEDGEPYDKEYVERDCKRCGYTWEEIPLDAVRSDEQLLASLAGDLLAALAEITAWIVEQGLVNGDDPAEAELLERAQGLIQQGEKGGQNR